MPAASVIVPARDARATLPRTLRALSRQRFPEEFEVIVVDDGSSDDTAGITREAAGASSDTPARITLLSQPPRGPAAARNLGVRSARGRVLAFCDADVYPAPGWLEAGVAALRRADLVQGKVLPDPDAPLGPFDRTLWITLEAGLYETANLFVTRDCFERAGGFEDWLQPRSGKALAEDVWFGYRALRLGARSSFCADALAFHAVFPRGWRAYAGERRRLEYFPAMVGKMPELRRTFLHRRLFLNQRTARLDLALAGCSLAAVAGSAIPLTAAIPYVRRVLTTARRGGGAAGEAGPRWGAVAAADVAADLVGLVSLLGGSVRYGAPVL